MTDIVLYTAKNGQIELDVNLADETVWLSINQMSKLFGRDKSVILYHLGNVYKTYELDREATVANFATVQKEGEIEDYFEYISENSSFRNDITLISMRILQKY